MTRIPDSRPSAAPIARGVPSAPRSPGLPAAEGLYDPANEHDACGVGFVVNMHGRRSHGIVRQGLEVLENLTHRGAGGCDPLTGDGAGILIQMPQEFFNAVTPQAGIRLPAPGDWAVGNVFLPPDPEEQESAEAFFARLCQEEGQVTIREAKCSPLF